MSMWLLSKHVKESTKFPHLVESVVWLHTTHQCLYRAQVRNPYNEAFMGSCTWAMLASSPGHTPGVCGLGTRLGLCTHGMLQMGSIRAFKKMRE